MKKSEILREFFGSRVISYYRIGESSLLVVEVEDLSWSDFTPKFLNCIIDVQAATKDSIRVCFDVTEWD